MVETESERTPLQQKIDEFGEQLSKVCNVAVFFKYVLISEINFDCFHLEYLGEGVQETEYLRFVFCLPFDVVVVVVVIVFFGGGGLWLADVRH